MSANPELYNQDKKQESGDDVVEYTEGSDSLITALVAEGKQSLDPCS